MIECKSLAVCHANSEVEMIVLPNPLCPLHFSYHILLGAGQALELFLESLLRDYVDASTTPTGRPCSFQVLVNKHFVHV